MTDSIRGGLAATVDFDRCSGVVLAVVAGCLVFPAPVYGAIEEILVTAERRTESLQDVPASITALDGEHLRRSSIQDATDLPLIVPGLIISQIGASQITLRGISTQAQDIGGDPGVASYRDDIYLARPGMGFQEFYDIERVEVLRGPQGTLFGRNTTGGVIHAVSRSPGEEVEGYLTGQYGRFDKIRFEGAVNVPVVEDRLAVRIAGVYANRDGYLTNLYDGSDVQDLDVYGIRVRAKFTPNDAVTAMLTGEYMKSTGVNDPFKALSPGLANFPPLNGYSPIGIADEINQDAPLVDDKTNKSVSLRIDWDVSESVTLTSVTGWRSFDTVEFGDLDDTELSTAYYDNLLDTETFQQEFQVHFEQDNWQAIGGVFIFTEDASQYLAFPFPVYGVIPISQPEIDTSSFAAYGQATYNVTDRLRLTGGIRYTKDDKEFFNLVDLIPFFTGATQEVERTDDEVTGRVALEYDVNENVLAYASLSRGFKSGGFNGSGLEPPFEPEYLLAYEVGSKAILGDGRVQLNVAGFYYDYTDVQVQRIVNVGSSIDNAGEASGIGAEFEMRAELTEGLAVDVGISLADVEFDEFLSQDPILNLMNPMAGEQDLSGNKLPRVAPFSGHFGVEYAQQLNGAGMLTVRGEAQHQGRIYFDQFNRAVNSEESFTVFNARISYETESQGWYVAIFGRNLGDKFFTESRFEIAESLGTVLSVVGPPREWGIEMGLLF